MNHGSELKGNAVILDNLRSAHNTGGIYRSAYSFGFSTVIHAGITPKLENPAFIDASRGVEKHMKSIFMPSTDEALNLLKSSGYSIYSLEIEDGADNLESFMPSEPYAIIVGNEALGISQSALERSDKIIRIETAGRKDSLNVGVAFGILAYRLFLKSEKKNKLSGDL